MYANITEHLESKERETTNEGPELNRPISRSRLRHKYKGARLLNGRYVADVCVNSHSEYLGVFDSEEFAAHVHDVALIKMLKAGSISLDQINHKFNFSPDTYSDEDIQKYAATSRKYKSSNSDQNVVIRVTINKSAESNEAEQTKQESINMNGIPLKDSSIDENIIIPPEEMRSLNLFCDDDNDDNGDESPELSYSPVPSFCYIDYGFPVILTPSPSLLITFEAVRTNKRLAVVDDGILALDIQNNSKRPRLCD